MRKTTRARKILPVDLLIENRRCLVVGGGAIAARKAGHLLHAGARVTVVCPEAGEVVQALASKRRVRLVRREFRVEDVRGCTVVFAATDRPAVNRRVLAACRARGVLCSAADANWTRGSFVTPAICRHGGLTVTVSTGGASCRRARVVKDRLGEWLTTLDTGIHTSAGQAV